jgi:predicted Rdx family selenoprotein
MTNTVETAQTPQAPRKADGTLTTQVDNQTFIFEVFFNHESKETFQDKLLRVVLAEETGGFFHANK